MHKVFLNINSFYRFKNQGVFKQQIFSHLITFTYTQKILGPQ